MSNELYGNDFCSSHELAKGFTRHIESGSLPKFIPQVGNAREILMAKRKLNLILKPKSTTVAPVKIGDLFKVFIKLQHEKGASGLLLSQSLAMTKKSSIITLPGQNGRKIKTTVEDSVLLLQITNFP